MNTFTLLTTLGASGAMLSFIFGARALAASGMSGHASSRASIAWRMAFDIAVFVTIFAAPLAR